ncbi:MAG: nucleoside triphosphatase [Lachnospiraceae bacterium]|nr:MAG: nucleoside triphosphatase [Lachnospiraceae bacterium]DAI26887.1 MAG TPA: hypothetical protein [Caudoviricetes sp.]DAQ25850.1 MAG TPA: hypothetical protein [Caudoviricetes sp.]
MKCFMMESDKNRIYFYNYRRISSDEELRKVQILLKNC